jgi:hypothetical protein
MYCPKCRTEYRKNFNTCADCEIALVEELPPATENELPDNRLHPIRDQINITIEYIRSNQKASWVFSLIVGALFYFVYILFKNIWAHTITHLLDYMASLVDFSSTVNVISITIGANVITDVPAAFIASLFCAGLLIYILRKQQLRYSLGAASSFFLLDVRHWHFWKAPDIGLMISSFIGPFLVAFIFIASAWLLVKFHMQNR